MYSLNNSQSIWLTGYPSSGKTTISKKIFSKLGKHIPIIILDSDECNKIFYTEKKYSKYERNISTLKYIKLTKILLRAKCLVIISANHAFLAQRSLAREKLKNKYLEFWISTGIKECKKRDVKKLYLKAKNGNLKNLVGYDLKFDKPLNYDLKINTENYNLDKSTNIIVNFLLKKKIIYVNKT